jgi:hypothetical protein
MMSVFPVQFVRFDNKIGRWPQIAKGRMLKVDVEGPDGKVGYQRRETISFIRS